LDTRNQIIHDPRCGNQKRLSVLKETELPEKKIGRGKSEIFQEKPVLIAAGQNSVQGNILLTARRKKEIKSHEGREERRPVGAFPGTRVSRYLKKRAMKKGKAAKASGEHTAMEGNLIKGTRVLDIGAPGRNNQGWGVNHLALRRRKIKQWKRSSFPKVRNKNPGANKEGKVGRTSEWKGEQRGKAPNNGVPSGR